MLSVEQALEQILTGLPAHTEYENLPLIQAQGRILAQTQYSNVNVPPADNSAMDGYALNTADLNPGENSLRLSQRVAAGTSPLPLEPGTAARIFTGAEIPSGANAVVMQEKTREENGHVFLDGDVAPKNNIRSAGQDLGEGQVIFEAGRTLSPQDMGVLASTGIAEVPVIKRIKVAVISTGDELIEPGNTLQGGQIYNSNRYLLVGLLQKMNMECIDFGITKDDPDAVRATLEKAAEQTDCILTSGGVSVGEEDYVKAIVEELGQLDLWRLALKPGKPLAFGNVNGTPFFGLPGNPASVFVTFMIFVRPYLYNLQGLEAPAYEKIAVTGTAQFTNKKPIKRQEYVRVKMKEDHQVEAYSNQSSGVLFSTAWANAFAVIPPDTLIEPGDKVSVLPFDALYL